MPIGLYMMKGSLPCQVVCMVAKHLGIDLNKNYLDCRKSDHLNPNFLKINPQHCAPTIDDNGFYLWESRAIITYLVDNYAPNNELYPKDPKERAIIDRILYFDIGTLHKSVYEVFVNSVFKGIENEEQRKTVCTNLKLLDGFLENNSYVAGNRLTVADFSVITTVAFSELLDFHLNEFPNVQSWFSKVKDQLPYWKETSEEGIETLKRNIANAYKK